MTTGILARKMTKTVSRMDIAYGLFFPPKNLVVPKPDARIRILPDEEFCKQHVTSDKNQKHCYQIGNDFWHDQDDDPEYDEENSKRSHELNRLNRINHLYLCTKLGEFVHNSFIATLDVFNICHIRRSSRDKTSNNHCRSGAQIPA